MADLNSIMTWTFTEEAEVPAESFRNSCGWRKARDCL